MIMLNLKGFVFFLYNKNDLTSCVISMSCLLHDSLQEQKTHGTFVPHGCHDLLNISIGRPEHPGRVCATGTGVTISQYFGQASCASNSSSALINPQQFLDMIKDLKEELRREVEEENKKSLEKIKEFKEAIIVELSQRASWQSPPVEADIQLLGARVNTKGSCAKATTIQSRDKPCAKERHTIGLYIVGDHCACLVSLGKVYEGTPTIHNVPYAYDVVRVL